MKISLHLNDLFLIKLFQIRSSSNCPCAHQHIEALIIVCEKTTAKREGEWVRERERWRICVPKQLPKIELRDDYMLFVRSFFGIPFSLFLRFNLTSFVLCYLNLKYNIYSSAWIAWERGREREERSEREWVCWFNVFIFFPFSLRAGLRNEKAKKTTNDIFIFSRTCLIKINRCCCLFTLLSRSAAAALFCFESAAVFGDYLRHCLGPS